MKEILPKLWRWTAPHPEWRPKHEWAAEVASYALELPTELVFIDPLVSTDSSEAEETWSTLDRLATGKESVQIMVTIPYHVRSSEAVHRRYHEQTKVDIWGHPALARRLSKQVRLCSIEPGEPLPAQARALAIGTPHRQEMPLYFPSHRALAFGDSVVGVNGTLRVWLIANSEQRRRWYRDRFVPSLEPLLELDIAHVLVTHGPPVIGHGKQELARALAGEPWDYRHS